MDNMSIKRIKIKLKLLFDKVNEDQRNLEKRFLYETDETIDNKYQIRQNEFYDMVDKIKEG